MPAVEAGRENQVTEVWYSMKLGDETYQSLCSFLRELSNMTSSEQLKFKTNGLLEIHDRHLNELKAVWKTWLDLPVVKSDWITKQRSEAFQNDPGSEYGRYSYYQSIPSEHVKSAKQWMMNGVFVATNDPLVAENPTMTGTPNCMPGRSYSFCFDSSILPFKGWDYLQVKKFKHCNSLVEMYTAYINDVLRQAKVNLVSGHICIDVVLADCFDIKRYLRPKELFDRIFTSNLVDHVSLTSLLKLCSERLNHSNPYAIIVTETLNWVSKFCPDASVHNVVNPSTLPAMAYYVVKDTGSTALLEDGGHMSYADYYDNSNQFIEYLRATFHALSPEAARGKKSQSRCRPPFFKQLGNEFQLQLRDFLRNENRIAFFKMALNCRRPCMLTGHERVLEWIPLKKD